MPPITHLWTQCPYYDICRPYDLTTKCSGCSVYLSAMEYKTRQQNTLRNSIPLVQTFENDITINKKENEKMITAVIPNPNDIQAEEIPDMVEKKLKKRLDDSALYEEPPINVKIHGELCDYLKGLYVRKNHDYGDSFHATYLEEGMAMPRIRLADKFSRFKTLSRNESAMVNDESLRDTLLDLANYAIMTVVEMDRAKEEK